MKKATDTKAAEGEQPANVAPATEFDPAGAPLQTVGDVDPSHPAVDNDPRAGTTVDQNRIDFNDPTLSSSDAVAKALGQKTAAEAEAAKKKSED